MMSLYSLKANKAYAIFAQSIERSTAMLLGSLTPSSLTKACKSTTYGQAVRPN